LIVQTYIRILNWLSKISKLYMVTDGVYTITELRTSDPKYAEAMIFYCDAFGHTDGYTDSRKITHWLELIGSYHALIILKDNKIVGFLYFGHYASYDLLIIDYYRLKDVKHAEVSDLLTQYFNKFYRSKFVVTEVVTKSRERLFRKLGFKTSYIDYYHPPMEADAIEFHKSILLIKSDKILDREEELKLLECIYFQHYGIWNSIYGSSSKGYNEILKAKFEEIRLKTT